MAEITVNPFGVGGETPTNIGIVNDLTTGGADKALSAEQGKILGRKAVAGLYLDSDDAATENVYLDTDDFGNIAVGSHVWGSDFETRTWQNNNRATEADVIDNDLPDTFDIYVPSGYKVGVRWYQADGGPAGGANAYSDWYSTAGWQTITNKDKTTWKYIALNFGLANDANFGDATLATLNSDFKIRYAVAVEPAVSGETALSLVNANGTEVAGFISPVAEAGEATEVYTKDAVDGLLAGFTPGGGTTDQSSKARRNLRVAHWNVGHFYLGRNMADGNFIFRTDGENLQKAFTNKVRQIAADVFMMCEWYTCTQSEAIFGDFPYSDTSVGSDNTREYAFKSNFKLNSVEIVNFGVNNLPNETFKVAEITMGDETIALIECHLYFSGVSAYSSDKTYRAAEIQAILNYVSTQGYDRVIIAGDFNNGKPNDTLDEGPHEMDVFKTAGYKMFNFDFYDRVNTYPATGIINSNYTPLGLPSIAIDNIMCKGCSIVAAEVVDDGRLTDHCCVVCDIVLDDLN